jgi:hypothetical protein
MVLGSRREWAEAGRQVAETTLFARNAAGKAGSTTSGVWAGDAVEAAQTGMRSDRESQLGQMSHAGER